MVSKTKKPLLPTRERTRIHAIDVAHRMLTNITAATHKDFFEELENALSREGYTLMLEQQGIRGTYVRLVRKRMGAGDDE